MGSYGYGKIILFCDAFYRSMAPQLSMSERRLILDYVEVTVKEREAEEGKSLTYKLAISYYCNIGRCPRMLDSACYHRTTRSTFPSIFVPSSFNVLKI